jgi:hypothetical protein
MRWLVEMVRKLLLRTYLETYFEQRPAERKLFAAWRAIMTTNYFVDVSLPEEEKNLMAIIEDSLAAL